MSHPETRIALRTTLVGLFFLVLSCPVEGRQDPTSSGPAGAATSCLACHGNSEWFGEEAVERVVAGFHGGAHAAADLSCHDCHGGNPDPALAEDLDAAMDPDYEPNPYVGVPERRAIPGFCGECHSDPETMRSYQPDPRVDQEREYWTSHHGRALEAGDPKVATCIDCHGTHGILGATATESPVHPARVARTCEACHGDPEFMDGYTTAGGLPLPVDQYARWTQSVHAEAMYEKEDLSAPTCNDCHGNHGATPPGLDSIAFVCGQCHGREAELFRASGKRRGFQAHNEYVEGLGPDSCAACHEAPEPQADLTGLQSFSECSSCHGNHAVVRPTVAMLAPLPEIPCAFCHQEQGTLVSETILDPEDHPEGGVVPPEPGEVQRHYEEVRDELLATGRAQGLDGEELFDWMVDRALEVPAHTLPPAESPGAGPALRPEFERLFLKFRIGKTHFTYEDPVTGEPARGRVRRCNDCHAPEPLLADEPLGYATGGLFLESMRELTTLTARAERITLAAQRGGVLVEDAALAVDRAVDAQIQQEVLVHTFTAAEGSQFMETHQEGIEQARTALELAQGALEELAFRRRGLAVFLGLVVLVLVGLALKIRQLGGG
ncbi:MAG: hypothetical protein ACOC7L_00990 [Acidobacteriota bacterium]